MHVCTSLRIFNAPSLLSLLCLQSLYGLCSPFWPSTVPLPSASSSEAPAPSPTVTATATASGARTLTSTASAQLLVPCAAFGSQPPQIGCYPGSTGARFACEWSDATAKQVRRRAVAVDLVRLCLRQIRLLLAGTPLVGRRRLPVHGLVPLLLVQRPDFPRYARVRWHGVLEEHARLCE